MMRSSVIKQSQLVVGVRKQTVVSTYSMFVFIGRDLGALKNF